MNILYLAHDLDDAAIWRRVRMLRQGGAHVTLAGFRRGTAPLGEEALTLGQTQDGKLVARAVSVARWLPKIGRILAERCADAAPQVILARNLEMLLLGRACMQAFSAQPALVYELLDVHRVMLGDRLPSRMLRGLEARLMRHAAEVWISSPGFDSQYLRPYRLPHTPRRLVENKPFATEVVTTRLLPAEKGRITIGWFGILRCRWSLHTLDALTRAAPGRYRILLRGRPQMDVLPDFDRVVAANPDMEFGGAYRWPEDLPDIYGACDLAWLIDRYDAGANSDWLLPNRLYEGGLHGAVPITLCNTEVDRRTAHMGCGLHVATPELAAVTASLSTLSAETLSAMRECLAALPRSLWQTDKEECNALVDALRGLGALHSQAQKGKLSLREEPTS
ncbi:glycosyl transferase [Sagittula sp. S175]|uniref:glycosyl transferase n=1 Tax=Sagittula sp. S175 TaxID=3415129 RepID=UPI003C7B0E90